MPRQDNSLRATFALTIIVGACLLFQIQPLVGKLVTAQFGGVAAVWCVCILFFQTTLLLGYSLTYWLTRLPVKSQVISYCLLWVVSVTVLNIPQPSQWYSDASTDPVLALLMVLSIHLALPCLLLSSISGLLQSWYATDGLGDPYPLYSLSNIGSLSALLLYPLVIETTMGSSQSLALWRGGYVFVACLAFFTALQRLRKGVTDPGFTAGAAAEPASAPAAEPVTAPAAEPVTAPAAEPVTAPAAEPVTAPAAEPVTAPAAEPAAATVAKPIRTEAVLPPRPGIVAFAWWLSLSALSSATLLIYTTHITQDIAPVPLLWVLPLSLYLLTFILCFAKDSNYNRRFFLYAGPVLWLLEPFTRRWAEVDVISLLSVLFCFCMTATGELARRKPHPGYLPLFYLAIAGGGVLGGILINLVAPVAFTFYAERYIVPLIMLALCFHAALADNVRFLKQFWLNAAFLLLLTSACILLDGFQIYTLGFNVLVGLRNFYGSVAVVQEPGTDDRRLESGTTVHGSQHMAPDQRLVPTRYYVRNGGMGYIDSLIRQKRGTQPVRYAVVGLGVGTMAAYGRPGDDILFYEIDPKIELVARKYFSFLSSSPATTRVVIADGRKALAHSDASGYDLLVIDAFNSDAIPTHLLTKEAITLYLSRLKTDGGILLIHISNRYADLEPILANLAAAINLQAITLQTSDSKYVSLSQAPLPRAPEPEGLSVRTSRTDPSLGIWTDDHNNLLPALVSNFRHR